MSEKKFLRTRRKPASAPAAALSLEGTVARKEESRSLCKQYAAAALSLEGTVALSHKQARRPLALVGSNLPVILLAENRAPVRVAVKNALEATGYDVIVVERASEALSIGAGYDGHIDFLITNVRFSGMNVGLLAELFQCTHPETRVFFISGSREEVLICSGAPDQKITVLEQPVRLDAFASKVSEMIRDSARYSTEAVTN